MGFGRSFLAHWFRGRSANLAGAVYGTILVTAVIVGASASEEVPLGALTVTVAVTTGVFWLAHVYADALAHSVSTGSRISWDELRGLAVHEWPLFQSALPPLAILLLGWFGLFERRTALWLAVGGGVVALVIWGFVYARREHLGPIGTLLSVSVNAAFGLIVIVLKAIVSH